MVTLVFCRHQVTNTKELLCIISYLPIVLINAWRSLKFFLSFFVKAVPILIHCLVCLNSLLFLSLTFPACLFSVCVCVHSLNLYLCVNVYSVFTPARERETALLNQADK